MAHQHERRPRRRLGWRLWMVVVLALGVAGVLADDAAAIPVTAISANAENPAGPAIRALTGAPPSGADPVPGDFAAVMGYEPVRVVDTDGRVWWVAPKGACSAPTGPTWYDFSLPCRAHDLGYDLLRYAVATGRPLGPWARQDVDAAFGRALAHRCAAVRRDAGRPTACPLAAAAYHGVVVANSWRQDWGDPKPEPALRWILLASALTLAPVLVNVVANRAETIRSRAGGGQPADKSL